MPSSGGLAVLRTIDTSTAVTGAELRGTSAIEIDSSVREPKWIDHPSSNIVPLTAVTADTVVGREMLVKGAVPSSRMKVLQHWEGIVESVEPADFTARLRDLSNPNFPTEQVRLSKEEVSDEDVHLVDRGAVFYWFIGRAVNPFGQVERVSRIRFRRLPAWTQRRLERAAARAREFRTLMRADSEPHSSSS